MENREGKLQEDAPKGQKKLQIETLVLGEMEENAYLAMNPESGAMFLVDPGAQPERVIRKIEEMGGKPELILLTHGHFDHIGAVDALRERYGIPAAALEQEQEILEDERKNLSGVIGRGYRVKADRFFRDNETFQAVGRTVRVIHTPGHTTGSACYYLPEENVLFSGDTLFYGSVGRTDFPTGSMGQLCNSLHSRLYVLPDETLVLPGHNSSTSLAFEKKYNPY